MLSERCTMRQERNSKVCLLVCVQVNKTSKVNDGVKQWSANKLRDLQNQNNDNSRVNVSDQRE